MKLSLVLLLGVAILASCRARTADKDTVDTTMVFVSPGPAPPGAPILRIRVLKDGVVDADGKSIAPPRLDSLLSSWKTAKGQVWLYLESGAPESIAKHVVEQVLRQRLPNSLSERPDFSDLPQVER